MKNIMKEAHNLTKKIIRKGDNYKATFRICLSFVHSQVKKGVKKMVELKGSEKQVKWANDIREELIRRIEEKKAEKLGIIKGDRVKKNGKVIVEAERKSIHGKRFDNAIEFILNQKESTFFIENFKNIHQWSKYDMWIGLQGGYAEKFSNVEQLKRIVSYWQ